MGLIFQQLLSSIHWYGRARQGFVLLCSAALGSVAMILVLGPQRLSTRADRMAIVAAPALAFALGFCCPQPRPGTWARQCAIGALAMSLLAFGLLWLCLPQAYSSWSPALGWMGLASALLGGLAGWASYLLSKEAPVKRSVCFEAQADFPTLSVAAFEAASLTWPEWGPWTSLPQDGENPHVVTLASAKPEFCIEMSRSFEDQPPVGEALTEVEVQDQGDFARNEGSQAGLEQGVNEWGDDSTKPFEGPCLVALDWLDTGDAPYASVPNPLARSGDFRSTLDTILDQSDRSPLV